MSCQSCTGHRTALECELIASRCPDLAFPCSATSWHTAQHFGTQTDSQVLKMMLKKAGKVCAQQYPQTGTSSSANRHSQKRSGTQVRRLGWHFQEELMVTSSSMQLLKKIHVEAMILLNRNRALSRTLFPERLSQSRLFVSV